MSGEARQVGARQWVLVDHVCRHCLGRMLRSTDHGAEFICSSCEKVSVGGPEGVCACGIQLSYTPRGERSRPVARRARFHCGMNPDRGFRSPAVVVVLFSDGASDQVVQPEGGR